MTTGITLSPRISAKNENLISFTVVDLKTTSAEKIVNYPAQYLGVASSLMIDNQDATNSVTVRINRGVNTTTIPASSNRVFNDSWIEQVNVTGSSTDTQITAQVVQRDQLGF